MRTIDFYRTRSGRCPVEEFLAGNAQSLRAGGGPNIAAPVVSRFVSPMTTPRPDEDRVARIDLARKILLEGVAQRKRELALRLYREGKVSKSRAAEIAGISLWELLDLAAQAELPAPYTLAEAVEDVRRLVTPLRDQATAA